MTCDRLASAKLAGVGRWSWSCGRTGLSLQRCCFESSSLIPEADTDRLCHEVPYAADTVVRCPKYRVGVLRACPSCQVSDVEHECRDEPYSLCRSVAVLRRRSI